MSRAGALSIAEIIAFAKPSILIPNPRCANNHQMANALYHVEQKVATCSLEENPNLAQELAGKLMYWSANPQAYYSVVETTKSLSENDALATVVTLCRQLYKSQDYTVEVDAME